MLANATRKRWGPRVRNAFWKEQGGKCFYCSETIKSVAGNDMHLDHIEPLAADGDDELENLCAACPRCNGEKSASVLEGMDGAQRPGVRIAKKLKSCSRDSPHETYSFGRAETNWRLRDKRIYRDYKAYYYVLMEANPLVGGWEKNGKSTVLTTELSFVDTKEPYYNVYPCLYRLAESLKGKKLPANALELPDAIPTSPVFKDSQIDMRTVELRFPIEKPYYGLKAAIVSTRYSNGVPSTISGVAYPAAGDNGYVLRCTIEDGYAALGDNEGDEKQNTAMLRFMVVLHLIGNDERFVERICPAKLSNRAKRKGNVQTGGGFTIGRQLESMPHFRRPHFAIRWMREDQPELVARLRPISGSAVGANIYDIPTGYGFDDGN